MLEIFSKDGKTYPETVAVAREAAEQLKKALEPIILGKELENGKVKAVEVIPAGNQPEYEEQIALWFQWSVKMSNDNGTYMYSVGLSQFLSIKEIEDLFYEHFKNIDTDTNLHLKNYQLSSPIR
jgi:hypothetical protein